MRIAGMTILYSAAMRTLAKFYNSNRFGIFSAISISFLSDF